MNAKDLENHSKYFSSIIWLFLASLPEVCQGFHQLKSRTDLRISSSISLSYSKI